MQHPQVFSSQTALIDNETTYLFNLKPKKQHPVKRYFFHTRGNHELLPEGTADTWLPAKCHAVRETQILPAVCLSEQLTIWLTAAVKGSRSVITVWKPTSSQTRTRLLTRRLAVEAEAQPASHCWETDGHGGCTPRRGQPIVRLTGMIPYRWEKDGVLNIATQTLLCGWLTLLHCWSFPAKGTVIKGYFL